MSRILITGATGFVGQEVVKYLSAAGHEVAAAMRDPGRKPKGVTRPFLTGPLETASWIKPLEGVEVVVHLAARVHQMHDTAADPLAEFRLINRDATARFAQIAAECGVKRFIYMSSVKAAIDSTGLDPVNETVMPMPGTAYGLSKLEAERALLDIARRTPLRAIILRPPMVYGAGAKGNLLSLFRLAALGMPLPFGAIHNRRSVIGVGNLAHAVCHALTMSLDTEPVYFLEDTTLSTPDLLRAVATASGRRARLFKCPVAWLRAVAKLAGQADKIDRLTESLAVDGTRFRATGWLPAVPMQAELERLADSLYPSQRR